MIKVGIYGGTGYMGGEVLRVLLGHPQVEVAWITSRSGGNLAFYHPNLYGIEVNIVQPEEAPPCDIVFLALPTGESIQYARRCLEKGSKVIDLGAAFRLQNREVWEAIYNQPHTDWELVQEAVYGITELHMEKIKSARLIANPGCFSSAAILGLSPLVKAKLINLGVCPSNSFRMR